MTASFILLMFLHELGHAYFVRKYGHYLTEIQLFPLHGHCLFEYDPEYELETLIFAGGLIVQTFVLVFWVWVVGVFNFLKWVHLIDLIEPATHIFVHVNVFLLLVNSLPIPGLDGYELWKRLAGKLLNKKNSSNNHKSKKSNNKSTGNIKDVEKIVDLAIKRAQKRK